MSRDILNHPVKSEDTLRGNSEPSPSIGKVQRLSQSGVGPSGPKRRRPGKGKWFDGEVCSVCGKNDRQHHAKGMCKLCYQANWYRLNPNSKSIHDKRYYNNHREEFLRKCRRYYLDNKQMIIERTKQWYRNRQFDGNLIRALERDGYACRNVHCPCNTTRLDVHHIDGRGIYHPEPNHLLLNLLTLCASCHTKVHMGHDIVWTTLKDVAAYDPTQIVVVVDGYGISAPC